MGKQLRKIVHIGFAVKDVEETIKHMRETYGLEPDRVAQMDGAQGRKYRGKDADFVLKIVFYCFENIELEFIQPLSGESCYKEFLGKHGDGMQHLCFDVEDLESEREGLVGKGFEVIQEGSSIRNVPGMCWAYFEKPDSIAHIIEVVNYAKFNK